MSQIQVVESVHRDNDLRAFSNREYVGGMYFMVALGMLFWGIFCGLLQGYALPLKRFESTSAHFANQKFVSFLYVVVHVIFFFLLTAAGGMTGWILAFALQLLWCIALAIVCAIRRSSRSKLEEDEQMAAADPNNVPADNDASGGAAADSTRPGGGDSARSGGDDAADAADQSAAARRQRVDGKAAKRSTRDKNPWAASPAQIAPQQVAALACSMASVLLCMAIVLIVVYAWAIPTYWVVQSDATGTTDTRVEEFQPGLTAKALQFMYAYPQVASALRLQIYVRTLTEYCGTAFTKNLTLEEDKRTAIGESWIDKYDINMSIFVRKNYSEFTSVNDWFTRAINLTYRPLPDAADAITSPADCRMLVFRAEEEQLRWFKGFRLDFKELIGNAIIDNNANYFEGGGMVIARLAPQDYHRFHSPVSGTVTHYAELSGHLWSVSADAARSGNDALLNQRKVLIIDAGPRIGKVAYVAIGATCVGSVLVQNAAGQEIRTGSLVDRGEQLGVMQFGGSTVVMLFARDRVTFESNLHFRSRFPVETLVNVNSEIGRHR